jgi:hypothetical protein
VEGEIAFFSMDVLLKVVTNSIVLLGLCGTVCVMICRYGLGTKSRFYSSILMEKVSVSRTYAQFAVRMIVASTFFDLIDDNASGEISKSEIFEKLRRLLQGVRAPVEREGEDVCCLILNDTLLAAARCELVLRN